MGCSAALDTVSEHKLYQTRTILAKLCCQPLFLSLLFFLKESNLLFAFTPASDRSFVCQE